MKINTIKIWPIDGQKSIKAKADINILTEHGELSAKGFRIIAKEPDILFVAPPQEKYMLNGQMKYKDILWLDRDLQGYLYSEITKRYRELITTN